jgi:hypothetical protein
MTDRPEKRASSKELLPYADKWDALSESVRLSDFGTAWGRLLGTALFVIGVIGGEWMDRRAVTPNAGSYFFLACFGVLTIFLIRIGYPYVQRFSFHCPRCGKRWPGLLNKAPLCAYCGLHLYQDS